MHDHRPTRSPSWIAIIGVLCLALTPAARAANPEMVGHWKLDPSRSDPMQRGGAVIDNEMKIQVSGDDLSIERTWRRDGEELTLPLTIVTDGEPHDLDSPLGSRSVRARWKKDRLNLSYTLSRGNFDLDVQESWQIKKGELVIQYATRVNERSQVRKEIYTRIEGDS